MPTKLSIIFYSMYGHVYKLTEAVVEGARSVSNMQVDLYRVPELAPDTILEQSGAKAAQALFAHIPIVQMEEIQDTDGFIFGTPIRFGVMCAQMRTFLERLGTNYKNTFANKVGSAYTGISTLDNTHTTTMPALHTALLQLGMVIVGVPNEPVQIKPDGRTSAVINGDSKRMPSAEELAIARMQGKHVAETTKALKQGRNFI